VSEPKGILACYLNLKTGQYKAQMWTEEFWIRTKIRP
jgi:hypothetical protein